MDYRFQSHISLDACVCDLPGTPLALLLLRIQMPEASWVPQEPVPSFGWSMAFPGCLQEARSPALPSPTTVPFSLLFPRLFSAILGCLSKDELLPTLWTDA